MTALGTVQPPLEQLRRSRVHQVHKEQRLELQVLVHKEQRLESQVLQCIAGQLKELRIPLGIIGQDKLEDQRHLHSMLQHHKDFPEHKRLNIRGRLVDVLTWGLTHRRCMGAVDTPMGHTAKGDTVGHLEGHPWGIKAELEDRGRRRRDLDRR